MIYFRNVQDCQEWVNKTSVDVENWLQGSCQNFYKYVIADVISNKCPDFQKLINDFLSQINTNKTLDLSFLNEIITNDTITIVEDVREGLLQSCTDGWHKTPADTFAYSLEECDQQAIQIVGQLLSSLNHSISYDNFTRAPSLPPTSNSDKHPEFLPLIMSAIYIPFSIFLIFAIFGFSCIGRDSKTNVIPFSSSESGVLNTQNNNPAPLMNSMQGRLVGSHVPSPDSVVSTESATTEAISTTLTVRAQI